MKENCELHQIMAGSHQMENLTQHVSSPSIAIRGISPSLLIQQVKNTVPFIFDPLFISSRGTENIFLTRLRDLEKELSEQGNGIEFDHSEYFELCLTAHHATVGSFVPTDVDNQIRFKLWHPAVGLETLSKMAALVLASYHWNDRLVSARWIVVPETGERLSGHTGEWFSTAMAAYGALRRKSTSFAADIAGLILREIQREAKIFEQLKKSKNGLGVLKACALISHNLGDLERVIQMWNLPQDDFLVESILQFTTTPNSSVKSNLIDAKNLYCHFMAVENTRHFALRSPRCLRKSADFLLPIGPFFDDWGKVIGKHPGLKSEEVGEIASSLVDGWERLKGTVGYARALSGILETFPGGYHSLSSYLPVRIARKLKSGELHSLCSISQKRFEDRWMNRIN